MKLKLTKRHFEILEFCEEPRLVSEIAERFGIKVESAYPYLSGLVRHGHLSNQDGPTNPRGNVMKLFFALQPGDAAVAISQPKVRMNEDRTVWNMDFMKAAHNPFGIAA